MKFKFLTPLIMAGLTLVHIQGANATIVTQLVYKLSRSTPTGNQIDPWTGWTSGPWNEAIAEASDLLDNELDYRSSFIDNPTADIQSVRVSMYSQTGESDPAVELAYIEFSPTGFGSAGSFFNRGNVTASPWTDIGNAGNYFSVEGHSDSNGNGTINRHWFVNQSYAGCPSDFGHMAVIQGTGPCAWDSGMFHTNDRAFIYSARTTVTDWDGTFAGHNTGTANLFAVHVTRDIQENVPEPTTLALLGLGLAGIGYTRRKQSKL